MTNRHDVQIRRESWIIPTLQRRSPPADQCHITFENDSVYSQTESIIAWDQLWKFLEDKKINSFTKTNWRYDLQLLDSLLIESRAKVNPAGFVKSIQSGTKCFAVLTNSNHFALFVSVSSFYKEDMPRKYYVAYNDMVANFLENFIKIVVSGKCKYSTKLVSKKYQNPS